MGKRSQPQRIKLNGHSFVLLTPEDHGQLEAARRKLGAAHVQRHTLAKEVERLQTAVAEAARRIERLPHPPECTRKDGSADFLKCPVCALGDILTKAREPEGS